MCQGRFRLRGALYMRLIGLGLAAPLTAFVLLLVASHPIAPVTAHAGGLPTPSTSSPATPTTSATATRNADPTEASQPSEPSETPKRWRRLSRRSPRRRPLWTSS